MKLAEFCKKYNVSVEIDERRPGKYLCEFVYTIPRQPQTSIQFVKPFTAPPKPEDFVAEILEYLKKESVPEDSSTWVRGQFSRRQELEYFFGETVFKEFLKLEDCSIHDLQRMKRFLGSD